MKIKVIFEYDETTLGGSWMNIYNLKLLLYSKQWNTKEDLLKIIFYEEINK